MQKGSILRTRRTTGPDVWEFRWREPGPDGRRKHRRMVVGTLQDLPTKEAALQAVQGILHSVDHEDPRVQGKAIRLRMLVEHYLQKELAPENNWKSHSTKVTVRGYINKWYCHDGEICTISDSCR